MWADSKKFNQIKVFILSQIDLRSPRDEMLDGSFLMLQSCGYVLGLVNIILIADNLVVNLLF